MTSRPAERARDKAAEADIADLRWPPSAADLEAISCVDVLSAGGGDLRAVLWQSGRPPRSFETGSADSRNLSTSDGLTAARRPAFWALAVAAAAVLAVATPSLLRTSRLAEPTLPTPAPPYEVTSAAPGGVAVSGAGTVAASIPRSASPQTEAHVDRALPRDEADALAPRLIATTVSASARELPSASPVPEASAPGNSPAAPAPIDVPPAMVPASLASTSIPSASFDASMPALASAIPVRSESGDTPSAPRREPPMVAASPASTSVAMRAADVAAVRETLSRYGAAYSRLDAAAARAVWPSVDARALGRAFAELRSQRVTFDACDVTVDGARAQAACRGAATYVPRAGDQSPRTEARDWRFELERGRDANWRIASANISVPRGNTRAR